MQWELNLRELAFFYAVRPVYVHRTGRHETGMEEKQNGTCGVYLDF